jgi:hypothetical protein
MKSLAGPSIKVELQNIVPVEPAYAETYLLSGSRRAIESIFRLKDELANPSNQKSGIQSINFLIDKNIAVQCSINEIPSSYKQFNLVYLDGMSIVDADNVTSFASCSSLAVIAPVFTENAQKKVSLNKFLIDQNIIEMSSEGNIVAEKSLAFHDGNGHIWINLIGRENGGVVTPGDEFEEVKEALAVGIARKLIDEDEGRKVVRKIYRKEELFDARNISSVPDLIVALNDGYGFVPEDKDSVPESAAISAGHCMAYSSGGGFLSGEMFKQDVSSEFPIECVMPLMFHISGIEIPSWMEGNVPEIFLNEDFLMKNPVIYSSGDGLPAVSQEDEDAIKERLKGLGYLD